MSQLARVIKAADSLRGVCQVEFLGIETVDGGPTITRLAARIQEAEDRGYVFEHLGTRHDCRVYRLVSRPENEVEGSVGERRAASLRASGPAVAGATRAGVSAPLSSEPAPLFEVGKPQYGYADQGELDAA